MRNFTALQLILFLGCALVAVAALASAGVAFGFALAGAAVLAVLFLIAWVIIANLIGAEQRGPRSPSP